MTSEESHTDKQPEINISGCLFKNDKIIKILTSVNSDSTI